MYFLYTIFSYIYKRPTVSNILQRKPDGSYCIVTCHSNNKPIVGGGWASFLNRTIFASEISTHVISKEYEKNVWGAGSSIRTVQSVLQKRGQTLGSQPCIMGATLGGWIFTSAHGSGGTDIKHSIQTITVYNREKQRTEKYKYPCNKFDPAVTITERSKYIILEVQIIPFKNAEYYLHVKDIESVSDMNNFMYGKSVNRMIFLDCVSMVSMVWNSIPCESTYGLGRIIPVWFISIGPRFFTWIQKSDWNRKATLSIANHFAPDPPYFSGLIARFFTNFEILVQPIPSSTVLWKFAIALQNIFMKDYPSARCEIRIEINTLFLDFSVFHTINFDSIFKLVSYHLNQQRLVFHKGKFMPHVLQHK